MTRFSWSALVALALPAFALAQAAGTPVGFPPLPVAVSSLGATVCGEFLYAYGGHAGKTHSYDTGSVLGTFHRLDLGSGGKWEALPGGPIAQGMNLVTQRGQVVRVGGMQPRNAPGTPADNHSLTECAAFDPKAGAWAALPPLPAGRSSHDAVAVGDKLVVVGGWDQKGGGAKPVWHDTALILDRTAAAPKWESVPQPFARRALTAAVLGAKVYALCGIDADAATSLRVDVLDAETKQWARGPDLPGAGRVGFSPAATVVGGRLVVSTSDGNVHRLDAAGEKWEKVAASTSRRMVHRIVPFSTGVILVGGASQGDNVGKLELVELAEKAPQ